MGSCGRGVPRLVLPACLPACLSCCIAVPACLSLLARGAYSCPPARHKFTLCPSPRSCAACCRAHQALVLLKKEVELCRLQADIGKRVEEKISKDQRRYFLMEQVGGCSLLRCEVCLA